jgi:hypothetical protein
MTAPANSEGPFKARREVARGAGPAIVVAAALVAALALSACGSSSSADSSTASETYVSSYDLTKYKQGTPERTVMEWWKAVQFANTAQARTYYAQKMGPTHAVLQSELSTASNQFTGIPTFSSAEVHGDRATLYFFAARPGSSAPPRALSVNLVKKNGKWGLADDQLLAQVVERVRAAEKQRKS